MIEYLFQQFFGPPNSPIVIDTLGTLNTHATKFAGILSFGDNFDNKSHIANLGFQHICLLQGLLILMYFVNNVCVYINDMLYQW